MHWDFENWNDMKHKPQKFWLVETFFFYWCKITPIRINDSESRMPQFSWGEGGGGGPYKGYMDA